MEHNWYVYAIFAGKQAKPCYVGISSSDKRIARHIGDARRGWVHKSNQRKSRTFIACARRGIPIEVRKLITGLDVNAAGILERFLIHAFGRRGVDGGCLLNVADGGAGRAYSHPLKPSTRAKLQAASKWTPEKAAKKKAFIESLTDEERKVKFGGHNRGRKPTPEKTEKVSKKLKGRPKPPRSQEHVERLTEANRKKGKITLGAAERIRQDPRTNAEIAKDYGVNQSVVSRIKTGDAWKVQ